MTTFVLVHGAYQGGWIWKPVVARLHASGHVAYAPTLDGCAERRHQVRAGITVTTHAQEIADFLFYQDLRDIVLAGTSSGGMVILKAAELARERIARLSFVDALALLPGERVGAITNRPTPRETNDLTTSVLARGRREPHVQGSRSVAARLGARPDHAPSDRSARRADGVHDLLGPAVVGVCHPLYRESVNPPEAHQRRIAEKLKASYHELDTGHYPMLSAPDDLTKLLLA